MQIVEIYCFTCYNWELTVMINFIVIWGAPLSHESCDNKKHMHLSNYIKTVTIKCSLYRDRIVPGYTRTSTYPISSYHRLSCGMWIAQKMYLIHETWRKWVPHIEWISRALHNIQQPLRGNKLKGAVARLRGMVFGDQICVYQFKQPCKLRPNF